MADITVYDFMNLNTEDRNEDFVLWEVDNCEYIYKGNLCDIVNGYEDLIVQSWNLKYHKKFNKMVVCLNVSLED